MKKLDYDVTIGNTLERSRKPSVAYTPVWDVGEARKGATPRKEGCFFCGRLSLFYEDYCKECYFDFVMLPREA